MQSWHNDIILDRLQQVRESISLINHWCSSYQTEDDFLCSSTGMAMLDASILRLQIIGEASGRSKKWHFLNMALIILNFLQD